MKFLVISQRAFPNSNFRLNDLTGHGRMDVLMRCILAACRTIPNDFENTIYCYLKGSDNQEEHGWLKWDTIIDNHDEVSLASFIQDNWNKLFTLGNLTKLIQQINYKQIIHLHEDGEIFKDLNKLPQEILIVLGAQSDLTSEDLESLDVDSKIKLTNESMLASHVIILYRQKMISSGNDSY